MKMNCFIYEASVVNRKIRKINIDELWNPNALNLCIKQRTCYPTRLFGYKLEQNRNYKEEEGHRQQYEDALHRPERSGHARDRTLIGQPGAHLIHTVVVENVNTGCKRNRKEQ
jgi:hypothetical protein